MSELVMADTFIDIMDAYIAHGRPETEGIPAVLYNENYILADWLVSQAIGGVRLMVADLAAARTVPDTHKAGEHTIVDEALYE